MFCLLALILLQPYALLAQALGAISIVHDSSALSSKSSAFTNPTSAIEHAVASPSSLLGNAMKNPSAPISVVSSTSHPPTPVPTPSASTNSFAALAYLSSLLPSHLPNATSNATAPISSSDYQVNCSVDATFQPVSAQDCFLAIQQILRDPDTMSAAIWGQDGDFSVPRSWVVGLCKVLVDSISTAARDTFQMALVARVAVLIVSQCIEPGTEPQLGGKGVVGALGSFNVTVMYSGH